MSCACMGPAIRRDHCRSRPRHGAGDLKLPRAEGRAGRAALRASLTSRRPGRARRSWSSDSRRGEEIVIDDEGTKFQAMTFNGSMPGPHDGRARGRLCRTDAGQPRHQLDAAQHRLPCGHRRTRRRRPDPRQPRRAGRAALEGHAHRACSSITARRKADDPLARRLRHARHRDGAAARRTEGRRGQAAALRPDLLHRRARPLHPARREGQVQDTTRRTATPSPTPWRSCAS